MLLSNNKEILAQDPASLPPLPGLPMATTPMAVAPLSLPGLTMPAMPGMMVPPLFTGNIFTQNHFFINCNIADFFIGYGRIFFTDCSPLEGNAEKTEI